SFIRFLATERGLSDNYQLSTRRSLTQFAEWCAATKKITTVNEVTQPVISEYLATRKRGGLAASSIKLIVVALKIFFRFLAGKGADGEFQCGGADPASDRQGKQDAARTGGNQSMRGAGRVRVDRAPEAGEAANEQRDFSFEPGNETDDNADLADRKGTRETFG